MNLEAMLPAEWRNVLRPALQTESFRRLSDFLTKEYAEQKVFPPEQDLFRAFRLTPPDATRSVPPAARYGARVCSAPRKDRPSIVNHKQSKG